MRTLAFKDTADGYYQVKLDDSEEIPDWCLPLVPCDVVPEAHETHIPPILTNYQGKVTLDAFRLFDEVDAMMQAEGTPRAAKLAWATGSFERQGSLVLHFANILGLTQEQVDQMFIYGASVE